MSTLSRRNFIKLAATSSVAGLGVYGCAANAKKKSSGGGHVVVIGGGAGGTIAAKYIRKMDQNIKVTLIEKDAKHSTCFMSNWILADIRDLDSLTHSYDKLASNHDIKIVHDTVTEIDAAGKKVKTAGGKSIAYDRCIVSPGVSFRWDSIEGYDESASHKVPHAWFAGQQTALLHKQLQAMPNGGLFVLAAPPNPFKCPPGPYERASLVAHYLKTKKPKSKVLILDAKDKFSKQGLFTAGWEKLYPGMIEWRSKANDGKVLGIDADKRVAMTEFDEIEADVLNVIPAQKAGHIAEVAGLTDDTGWCPVHHNTWESKIHPGVHVIGDAAIQAPLPKSGYAANSEAKVCAAAVVALLNGEEQPTPSWVNTCYSLIGPNYGISVAMVYNLTAEGKVGKIKGSGGLTPKDGNNALEAVYAKSWYTNIVSDMFG
ncbi:MAG: NAD(P)/FAD-dependent oxidoreductase [Pseudomonadota bacterium]